MISVYIAIAITLTFLLTNPVITLLHELGHACAHLLLTKVSTVDVYIGSYGDNTSKINFRLGKLYFHIKFAVLKGGLCKADKADTNYVKRITILLAGPLFSFIAICLFAFFIFNSEAHGAIKLYFFVLIIWSANSMYANLRPKAITETLDSDGKQILFVLKLKRKYQDYILAVQSFNRSEYEIAAEKLAIVAEAVPYEPKILRLLIKCSIQVRNFKDSEQYLIQLEKYDELKIEELLHYGYILSITERHEVAIGLYNRVLKRDGNNLIALNNLGYELTLNNDYKAASLILAKAINLNPDFAPPYSILGYLEIINGNLDTGKQLVDRSLEMDPNYAYSYKHLAAYYLKTGEKGKASMNLKKATDLDSLINLQLLSEELES